MAVPRFNYIITVFNKEAIIEKVLDGIRASAGSNSFVYPVLDGCTDGTEAVIDAYIKKHRLKNITKVYEHDVHEILSINAGLSAASHEGEGYNIILQDDVVLQEPELERKVQDLYKWGGKKLGYVSFRMGARFKDDASESNDPVPYYEHYENAYGHGLPNAKMLLPGQFVYRDVPIKSPVCIPFSLVRELGLLDVRLAPYMHDDLEYGIRAIKAGYYNGVFAVKFQSKIEWGGTRQNPHTGMAKMTARNMDLIREWHKDDIKKIIAMPKKNEVVDVPGAATEEEREEGRAAWLANQKELDEYQQKSMSSLGKVATVGRKSLATSAALLSKLARAPKVASKVAQQKVTRKWAGRKQARFMKDMSFTEASAAFPDPNDMYAYAHHYFYHFLPSELREHRTYFSQERRGFGEDAFHAMWFLLLREFKPKHCLEIGVYRGQVVSGWALINKLIGNTCAVFGVSPFTPAGDEVSVYLETVDYQHDVLEVFKKFNLPKPTLIKALSTEPEAAKAIGSQKWDIIYIDGNHDYDVALADYELCKKNLAPKGIIVFDDSALHTAYKPYPFSTAGHPGPTKVVEEIVRKEMNFLGAVGHNTVFQKR